MWGVFGTVLVLCLVSIINANHAENWEENAHEVLIRNTRGAEKQPCKYDKSSWSECDPNTHMKNRTLTLKKGSPTTCEATKSISRKCKKGKKNLACRYEKGSWSQCSVAGDMTRTDMLKEANSDANCEKSRTLTKKCKAKNSGRKNKANNGEFDF
ncbi:pleiotrophin-A-like isoform X1 [Diaphorina citri]|uniref:Pleiotrophin-A-like isoform X1 n=1 Tax=Diaphorina citri TaxID=121845 RepID=A0A1S4EFZ1_DIACI|nr:pleiotrophin-A-like isoform X1 [Diaphorina citri]